MKLLILGATGGTGIQLVNRSFESGHTVTAFVRRPQSIAHLRDRIKIVQGNLLDASELTNVLRGQDAVLSGFGPRIPIARTDANLLEDFGTALVTAMERAAVRRAIVISTAFLFKDSILPPAHLVGNSSFAPSSTTPLTWKH